MNKNTPSTQKISRNLTTKKGQKKIDFRSGHDLWMKLRGIKNSPTGSML